MNPWIYAARKSEFRDPFGSIMSNMADFIYNVSNLQYNATRNCNSLILLILLSCLDGFNM